MNPNYVIMNANNNYVDQMGNPIVIPVIPPMHPMIHHYPPVVHHNTVVQKPPFCERCGKFSDHDCKEIYNVSGMIIDRSLCSTCGLHGHLSKECRSKPPRKYCKKCSGFGHFEKTCIATSSIYGDDLVNPQRCRRCNYFGHSTDSCIEKRTSCGELIVKCVGAEKQAKKIDSWSSFDTWYVN